MVSLLVYLHNSFCACSKRNVPVSGQIVVPVSFLLARSLAALWCTSVIGTLFEKRAPEANMSHNRDVRLWLPLVYWKIIVIKWTSAVFSCASQNQMQNFDTFRRCLPSEHCQYCTKCEVALQFMAVSTVKAKKSVRNWSLWSWTLTGMILVSGH